MKKLTTKERVHLSRPTLHPPVVSKAEHVDLVKEELAKVCEEHEKRLVDFDATTASEMTDNSFELSLSTVSMHTNYDSHLYLAYEEPGVTHVFSLILDTGNTVLVMPYFEYIENLADYQVLAENVTEPFGCPANIVKGPIKIMTKNNPQPYYTLENVIFYACTGSSDPRHPEQRTANFGAGCITPWSTGYFNNHPGGISEVIKSPLAYNTDYPYAGIINGIPSEEYYGFPLVNPSSSLTMYRQNSKPAQYVDMNIVPNLTWMSVMPFAISMGTTPNQWPGTDQPSVAFIDTGGGPAFLSDPYGYLWDTNWGGATTECPVWTNSTDLPSTNCNCYNDDVMICLWDGRMAISYLIEPNFLPPAAKSDPSYPDTKFVTMVPCEENGYMMSQYGMNIGGLSCLFLKLLIDYSRAKISFKLAYW